MMQKNKFGKPLGLLVMVGLIFCLIGSTLYAFEAKDDDEIIIGADEVIPDDLYVGTNRFVLDGTIQGDLLIGANRVTINGTVQGDVFIGANTVIINGLVEGDLSVGAQALYINGEVKDDVRVGAYAVQLGSEATLGDDLLVGAYSLEAQSNSHINGSLAYGASQVLLAGNVAEDVIGSSLGLDIQGLIGGDVAVEVGPPQAEAFNPMQFNPQLPPIPNVSSGLILGPEAQIKGNLSYDSSEATTLLEGRIDGQTAFNQNEQSMEEMASRDPTFLRWISGTLRVFIGFIVVGLLGVMVLSGEIRQAGQAIRNKPFSSVLLGLLLFIVTPIVLLLILVVLIFIAVLLGWLAGGLGAITFWFGFIILFSFAVLYGLIVAYLTKIVCAYYGGYFMLSFFSRQSNLMMSMLLGLVVLVLLMSIPIIGGLINAIATLFGLGALWLALRNDYDTSPQDKLDETPSIVEAA